MNLSTAVLRRLADFHESRHQYLATVFALRNAASEIERLRAVHTSVIAEVTRRQDGLPAMGLEADAEAAYYNGQDDAYDDVLDLLRRVADPTADALDDHHRVESERKTE